MMHLTVKRIIGKSTYTFTFMGETLHDTIMESQHLGFRDVFTCGLCESDWLFLRAYVTEKDKYEYVKIVCAKCGAQVTMGKAKKDGAFFLRKNEKSEIAWEAKPAETTAAQD